MDAKEKARWSRIKRVYGITKEDYDEYDKGYCPLCLRSWSDTVMPVVDHDHSSGYIRGILCRWCNKFVLGRLRDADVVSRIHSYLVGQPKKHVAPPKPKRKRKKKEKHDSSLSLRRRARECRF